MHRKKKQGLKTAKKINKQTNAIHVHNTYYNNMLEFFVSLGKTGAIQLSMRKNKSSYELLVSFGGELVKHYLHFKCVYI